MRQLLLFITRPRIWAVIVAIGTVIGFLWHELDRSRAAEAAPSSNSNQSMIAIHSSASNNGVNCSPVFENSTAQNVSVACESK